MMTMFDPTAIPREFTLVPFWFWNDELDEREILRQIADFEAHGVYGFVIHPRIGLPWSCGWMSDRLLHYMRVAIEEAARRNLIVFLYDEGMYPSGSSSGQVVAANPSFQCRGLTLAPGGNLVAETHRGRVYDAPSEQSHIRGVHWLDEAKGIEHCPPAADLLNPDAVACFIRLVYDRYYHEFREHFGRTIQAIFTDEPNVLGRGAAPGFRPGTTGILEHVNRLLGYDFTQHLPALWFDDEPDVERYRADYRRAVNQRLDETYYRQLSDWCVAHGVALCGHPDSSEDVGRLRYFQIPGQDLVWRYVEPDKPSALEGAHATMAKCSASAMVHQGRRRNLNEFCGAYGHELTFGEMKWLADWCLVRGVNLLVPHAFYYSVRGPRRDERPPDVGPHSAWWGDFKRFADYCRWLCWLNTDSRHVCDVAIQCESDHLPWRAAKVLHENQIDFHYLERGAAGGYRVVITDEMPDVVQLPRDVRVTPAQPDLRTRHVVKDGYDYYLLFNEGRRSLTFHLVVATAGSATLLDTFQGRQESVDWTKPVTLSPHEMRVLKVDPRQQI